MILGGWQLGLAGYITAWSYNCVWGRQECGHCAPGVKCNEISGYCLGTCKLGFRYHGCHAECDASDQECYNPCSCQRKCECNTQFINCTNDCMEDKDVFSRYFGNGTTAYWVLGVGCFILICGVFLICCFATRQNKHALRGRFLSLPCFQACPEFRDCLQRCGLRLGIKSLQLGARDSLDTICEEDEKRAINNALKMKQWRRVKGTVVGVKSEGVIKASAASGFAWKRKWRDRKLKSKLKRQAKHEERKKRITESLDPPPGFQGDRRNTLILPSVTKKNPSSFFSARASPFAGIFGTRPTSVQPARPYSAASPLQSPPQPSKPEQRSFTRVQPPVPITSTDLFKPSGQAPPRAVSAPPLASATSPGPLRPASAPSPGPSRLVSAPSPGPSRLVSAPSPGPSRLVSAPSPGPSRLVSAPSPGPSRLASAPSPGPSRLASPTSPGPSRSGGSPPRGSEPLLVSAPHSSSSADDPAGTLPTPADSASPALSPSPLVSTPAPSPSPLVSTPVETSAATHTHHSKHTHVKKAGKHIESKPLEKQNEGNSVPIAAPKRTAGDSNSVDPPNGTPATLVQEHQLVSSKSAERVENHKKDKESSKKNQGAPSISTDNLSLDSHKMGSASLFHTLSYHFRGSGTGNPHPT